MHPTVRRSVVFTVLVPLLLTLLSIYGCAANGSTEHIDFDPDDAGLDGHGGAGGSTSDASLDGSDGDAATDASVDSEPDADAGPLGPDAGRRG